MTAFAHDLYIEQGATYTKPSLTWKDGDGIPVNLTSWAARMQFRKSPKAPVVLFEATTENGRIILGGEAGTIDFNFSADDTESMSFASAVYDLELVAADETVVRLCEGAVVISPNVTRAQA